MPFIDYWYLTMEVMPYARGKHCTFESPLRLDFISELYLLREQKVRIINPHIWDEYASPLFAIISEIFHSFWRLFCFNCSSTQQFQVLWEKLFHLSYLAQPPWPLLSCPSFYRRPLTGDSRKPPKTQSKWCGKKVGVRKIVCGWNVQGFSLVVLVAFKQKCAGEMSKVSLWLYWLLLNKSEMSNVSHWLHWLLLNKSKMSNVSHWLHWLLLNKSVRVKCPRFLAGCTGCF